MTMIDTNYIKCKYCGELNEAAYIKSTTTFDGPNLDLRPAPLASGLFVYSCYYCKKCNYSYLMHSNINNMDIKTNIDSEEYQNVIKTVSNEYLRRFLLAALNHKYIKDYRNAAYSYLYASWIFDDKCNNDLYNDNPYRLMAAKQFLELEDITIKELLITIDLLRRNCYFEKALETLELFFKKDNIKPEEKNIANIQKELIELKNNYNFRTTDFIRTKESDYTPLDKVKKILSSKNIKKEIILKGNRSFPIKGIPKYVLNLNLKKYLILSNDEDNLFAFEFVEGKKIFCLKQIDNKDDFDEIIKKYSEVISNNGS